MLKLDATNEEIIEFIDEWASLLEKKDYNSAYYFTKQIPSRKWSSELIKELIENYADAEPNQKVTLNNNGLSIDGVGNIHTATQRKEVTWYDDKRGDIWYDLNIDGYVSDLTALFDLEKTDTEIYIFLDDIHVM